MNTTTSKYLIIGAMFVVVFILGYWMNRSGKPHSTLILTIHKLTALAIGIYLAINIYRIHQATPLPTAGIALVVITAGLFIVSIVTGSLLSTDKDNPAVITILNKIIPYITVASTALTIAVLF